MFDYPKYFIVFKTLSVSVGRGFGLFLVGSFVFARSAMVVSVIFDRHSIEHRILQLHLGFHTLICLVSQRLISDSIKGIIFDQL